jgi:hypothetical protein
MNDVPPREAEIARPWREGIDPPIHNTRIWGTRGAPHVEVYLAGAWCKATITMRQDTNGRVIYHLDVFLPGATGAVHRAIVWHPGSLRPRED